MPSDYESGRMDALGRMTPEAIEQSVKQAGRDAMEQTLARIMRQHGCTIPEVTEFRMGVKCYAEDYDPDGWSADFSPDE